MDAGVEQEVLLKKQYTEKVTQAVNLVALRKQRDQVQQYVGQLEKQLPSKAEMAALLSEINQAGVGRGAQLQLFKPGQVIVKEYYAELPIAVRVVGNYHDLGAFASDLANLRRIVTLNNVIIQQQERSGLLAMDAVAKTFRYLDPEEVAQQRAAAAKKKAGEVPKK
jgi:type IV pilus assembly protein PilO